MSWFQDSAEGVLEDAPGLVGLTVGAFDDSMMSRFKSAMIKLVVQVQVDLLGTSTEVVHEDVCSNLIN